MEKIACYPGSFNPLHAGHMDVINKALKIFEQVDLVLMYNPEKADNFNLINLRMLELRDFFRARNETRVQVNMWQGLLVDYISIQKRDCVIRGLRNGSDFEYEIANQYWNEDLGLEVPIVYFGCDRSLSHISSSGIRSLKPFFNNSTEESRNRIRKVKLC